MRLVRFSIIALLTFLLLQGCATSVLDSTPAVRAYSSSNQQIQNHNGKLKVMTLNLAHGRGTGFHQLFQTTTTTLSNLDAIATLLKNGNADVIALQEADSPSFWSGNFDHVDYLATNGNFKHSVRANHVDGLGLAYGTALMAKRELSNPRAITFNMGISPTPKGFVISTISWPGKPDVKVDIVSVHLSFVSSSIRKQQAEELIQTLRERKHPLIIMGDFNTDWEVGSTVQQISKVLNLSAYQPDKTGLETFPAFDRRIDWILISPELSFHSYRVLTERVSDHRGVITELKLNESGLGQTTALNQNN